MLNRTIIHDRRTDQELISKRAATTVVRSKNGPCKWPRVAQVMTNDSFKVLNSIIQNFSVDGDPLELAFAVNFLESLYRCGYAVVKLKAKEPK